MRTDRPDARPTSATVDNQGAFWAFYDEDRVLVRYAHGRRQEFSVTSNPDIGLVKVIYPDAKGVLIGGELGIADVQALSSVPAHSSVTIRTSDQHRMDLAIGQTLP